MKQGFPPLQMDRQPVRILESVCQPHWWVPAQNAGPVQTARNQKHMLGNTLTYIQPQVKILEDFIVSLSVCHSLPPAQTNTGIALVILTDMHHYVIFIAA